MKGYVVQMKKKEFIKVLGEKLDLSEEKCILINDVLEDNFLIGKNNKEKIISGLMDKLDVDETEANHIYEVVSSIITGELKEKLKHPFRSQD